MANFLIIFLDQGSNQVVIVHPETKRHVTVDVKERNEKGSITRTGLLPHGTEQAKGLESHNHRIGRTQ